MVMALTEQAAADLVEQLTGEVEHAFEVESHIANLFPITPIKGSDTKIDRVVGRAHVEAIDWTEDDKHAQVGAIGKITYTIEDSIYIRHAEKNIAPLLQDVDVLKELGMEHGKALAMQRDVTLLNALLIGSQKAAMTAVGGTVAASDDLDKTVEAGLRDTMAASGDEYDVTKLESKLEGLIIAQRARRKLSADSVLIMTYKCFNTLRASEKLISKDFSSDNGDYAKGTLGLLMGVPVIPVPTFQDLQNVVGDVNPIGTTWNVTTKEAQGRAVLFSPRALRVLEAMPVTVSAWYEKIHKTNFIDSQAYYGTGVRRQDNIAALFTFEAIALGVVSNVAAVGTI